MPDPVIRAALEAAANAMLDSEIEEAAAAIVAFLRAIAPAARFKLVFGEESGHRFEVDLAMAPFCDQVAARVEGAARNA